MQKLRERPKNSERAKHYMAKCNENTEVLESEGCRETIAEDGSWVIQGRKFYCRRRLLFDEVVFWLKIAIGLHSNKLIKQSFNIKISRTKNI